MGSEGVDVRFRHTQGDVGPFKFTGSTDVQSLKDKLLIEWPKGVARVFQKTSFGMLSEAGLPVPEACLADLGPRCCPDRWQLRGAVVTETGCTALDSE